MKFSQRIGKSSIKTELEREGLSDELRNSLWTLVVELILREKSNESGYDRNGDSTISELASFFKKLWMFFFKFPIDNLHIRYQVVQNEPIEFVRKWYFEAEWLDAFDFLEFCSDQHKYFQDYANAVLKREMSAYRFIDGILTPNWS